MRTKPTEPLMTHPGRTAACGASCRKRVAQIAKTKESILHQFRSTVQPHEHVLELALNEAEGLAWQTGYPHLVFPGLAIEKARTVAAWHRHQESIQQLDSPLAVE